MVGRPARKSRARPPIDVSGQPVLLIPGTRSSAQEGRSTSMKIRRLRRLRLVPVLLLVSSAVSFGGVAGASLPPQASDQGDAHAHTHGPDDLALDRRAPGA